MLSVGFARDLVGRDCCAVRTLDVSLVTFFRSLYFSNFGGTGVLSSSSSLSSELETTRLFCLLAGGGDMPERSRQSGGTNGSEFTHDCHDPTFVWCWRLIEVQRLVKGGVN